MGGRVLGRDEARWVRGQPVGQCRPDTIASQKLSGFAGVSSTQEVKLIVSVDKSIRSER